MTRPRAEQRYAAAAAELEALVSLPIDNTPPRAGRRLRAFLDARGAPDASMQGVVVAGTVGKGSTAACLAAILQACGERVGLFTGPHLVRYPERIRVNGRTMPLGEWARRVPDLLEAASHLAERPSLLEVQAVMALEWFAESGVRWAVMEAGVGGHRDHTMGLDPEVTVLTRIDLDHTHLLGTTVAEIAEEKCGAIRGGVSTVSASQAADAEVVVTRRADAAGAVLWLAGRDYVVSNVRTSASGTRFDYRCPPLDRTWKGLRVPLAGAHQAENAAAAVTAALRIWAHGRVLLSEAKVRRGLSRVRLPGRLERLAGPPDVVLDGAHQPAGARALRAALDEVYGGRDVFLVLGVLGDKDRDGIARELVGRATRVWFTMPPWVERAGDADELRAWARRTADGGPWSAEPDWWRALADAREAAACVAGAVVVVTGSLYLVGAARAALMADRNLRARQKPPRPTRRRGLAKPSDGTSRESHRRNA